MMSGIKQLLLRKVMRVIRPVQLRAAHDLYLQLQIRARESTARYVERHLFDVPDFDDKHALLTHAIENAKLEGSVLEFGVYKGASIDFIAGRVGSGVTVHGFDSFTGLPEFWRPTYRQGKFDLGGHLPRVAGNVSLHKGWFETTLPEFVKSNDQNVSLMHVDCDLYASTKTIFKCLGDRILPGTVIAFDEYFNHPRWQHGEYRAFQEFVRERSLAYQYLGYTRYDEQVVVKIV